LLFIYRHYVSDSEEECSIVDSDDDDTVSHARGTRRNSSAVVNAKRSHLEVSARNTQSVSGRGRRMGVSFDSGDSSEEDEFDRSIPQRKRKR